MSTWSLTTFAKLNLSLKLFRPREDGYHPICSIFQAVDLCDSLTISLQDSALGLTLNCDDDRFPLDHTNLLSRIYDRYRSKIPFGLHIEVNKGIPIQGGVGGGSGNAAGFLVFLNQICGWNYSREVLVSMGLQFGADVPFFFYGGRALVRGIGEEITSLNPDDSPQKFLLIFPNFSCSTADLFAEFDRSGTAPAPTPASHSFISAACGENDFKPLVFNRFQALHDLEKALLEQHAHLYLSGSGSTCFVPLTAETDSSSIETIVHENFPEFTTKTVRSLAHHSASLHDLYGTYHMINER